MWKSTNSLATFSQLALKLVSSLSSHNNNVNGAVGDIKIDSQVHVHSFMTEYIAAPWYVYSG